MSSTCTTTCDFCGAVAVDHKPRTIDSAYVYGKSRHICEECWERGLAAMAGTPDPTPQAEIDRAVADAVTAAKDPLEAQVAQLRTAARELETRAIGLTRELQEAEGACAQLGERSRELDAGLSKERKERVALERRERDLRFALAEVLAMLGKKARKRFADRLAEIATATGVEWP